MEVAYNAKAINDIGYWKKSGNNKIQVKIAALIEDIINHPYLGIGKPEPLKYELTGKWSRRIDKENRLIYAVSDNRIFIYSLRGHY